MNIKPILNKRPYVYAFFTGFALCPLNTNKTVIDNVDTTIQFKELPPKKSNDSVDSTFRNYFEASQKVNKDVK